MIWLSDPFAFNDSFDCYQAWDIIDTFLIHANKNTVQRLINRQSQHVSGEERRRQAKEFCVDEPHIRENFLQRRDELSMGKIRKTFNVPIMPLKSVHFPNVWILCPCGHIMPTIIADLAWNMICIHFQMKLTQTYIPSFIQGNVRNIPVSSWTS